MAAIPQPPEPHLVNPVLLQRHFTGRVNERETLSEWCSLGEQRLAVVVGPAGGGKSSLAWAWLQRDVRGVPLSTVGEDPPVVAQGCYLPARDRPEGIVWWRFCEQRRSFAAFADETVRYATGRPSPAPGGTEQVTVDELLDVLSGRRLLIVLDSFERQLRGYAALSAAYQGDRRGRVTAVGDEHDDACVCSDLGTADFLRRVSRSAGLSRVLIVSRLFPRELEGLAGCRRIELGPLGGDDAEAYLRAYGMRGTRAMTAEACEVAGSQPLALRLLAGLVVNDPKRPRDLALARQYKPADPGTAPLDALLAAAFEAVHPMARELLCWLAASRCALHYDAIRALFGELIEHAGIGAKLKRLLANFTTTGPPPDLDDCLKELVARGLVWLDPDEEQYELHDVVRAFAYERSTHRQEAHVRLRRHFRQGSLPRIDDIHTLDDAAPLIEVYHHTLLAGDYEEAHRLCRDQLLKRFYSEIGCYATCVALLRALFPDGEAALPRLANRRDQAWVANALANAYALTGQPRRAAALFRTTMQLSEQLQVPRNYAVARGNLAHQQLLLGELKSAEATLRSALELGLVLDQPLEEAVGYRELGQLLAYKGELEACAELVEKAGGTAARANHPLVQSVVEGFGALYALWDKDPAAALFKARRALDSLAAYPSKTSKVERELVRYQMLVASALVVLADQHEGGRAERLREADTHLRAALARCRRINFVELQPELLLTWAAWHRLAGQRSQAVALAEDALCVADRCAYRLKQAEAHSFLARLALEAGDRDAVEFHVALAQERAACDGPPHCYRPVLEQTRVLLERGRAASVIPKA